MSGVIPRMRLITVKMPELYVEGIDELVRIGRYSSRSEVIRVAIRDLLKKELWVKEASEI
ncbi:ribbon-helix-helix domain-containing protein [Desulfurococcus mucosus]|uniref:Putative transcriptional regulator, CopG/Arc/MetJ family n=1 Tax=Desulfurococcus mucosus (strain ATCC 35584 / DSM 2162 / JCM 9187 / O7/1) TaxID=765177 RepID=E8R7D0_DESM0|nr:ribbon-helix-helix domain-containing protein [Desulfurococcus mucosus]ADV65595.1 putative transcriptional regulator, CopG/Arc/MetJ family [Desulfurococcus mucosus DSM 2162]